MQKVRFRALHNNTLKIDRSFKERKDLYGLPLLFYFEYQHKSSRTTFALEINKISVDKGSC
jgi:hypothetical protein